MAFLTITVAGVDRTQYLCSPSAGEAATFGEALRERKTFSCEFLAREGLWSPLRGQGITVEHSTEGVIFGGYITVATRHVVPGTSDVPGNGAIVNKCTCVSYEQIMSRRLSIARTWTGQIAGGIFNEIIADSLTGEGFTTEVENGPTIPLFDIQEPRPTVREALDRLCELASTATDVYYWDASPTKVARFFRQDTYPAPFSLTDANPYVLESLYASVDETNQGIINRVFVYLGQFLLEEDVETFPGDSSATSFELDFPVGQAPTITIDIGAGPVAQTVGIDGSDTGKDWYWTPGSNQIRQDVGGTVLDPADTLSVTYRGLDRRALGPFDDTASATAEGALQGNGTGLYETFLELESVGTSADAETMATAWLERYKRATITFRGSTYTAGLRSGQELAINLTTIGLNLTLLVQSVTMTDAGAGRFLWTFTAIFGAARDDWKRALLGQAVSTSISGVGGGGGIGPAGPPGAAGTGIAAPNVTATAAVFYEEWANSQRFGFSGIITLPTGHADYAHLNRIDVMAVDSSGTSFLISSFTEWVGATIAYSGTVDEQPAANETWSVEFIVYNETGAPSPSPYTVGALVVSAAGLTSVSAAEVADAVWQDDNQGLHTVVAVTPVAGTLPLVVTLWLDFDDGAGWVWQGWWRITTGGQVIRIGDPVDSTEGTRRSGTIWVPTNPDNTSWKVAAAPGAVFKTSTPPAGFVEDDFTVVAVSAALTTDITDAAFFPDPVTSDVIVYAPTSLGGRTWRFYELRWEQPSLDDAPHYWHSVLTVQKGAVIGGIWTPAPITPDDNEGSNSHPGLYEGRRVTDASAAQGGDPSLGSTAIVRGDTWENWTYPPNKNPDGTPNLYRTFRFRIYSVSRRGTDAEGGTGVIVLNTCWPSSAAYYDLTPGAQPATLDLSVAAASSLNATMTVLSDLFGVAPLGITNPYVAALAIATTNVQDAAVALAKLADLSVSTAKIIDSAVGTAKLADFAATLAKLDSLSVDTSKLTALAVTTPKIAVANITTALIANLAVTTALIDNLQVSTAKVQFLAISTALMGDAAITTAKIANLAVTTALIDNAAITTAKIGNLQVTTALINTAAITSALIANLAVQTAHIADLQVTNAKIGDLSVGKLTAGTMTVASGGSGGTAAITVTGSSYSTVIYPGAIALNSPTGGLSGLFHVDSAIGTLLLSRAGTGLVFGVTLSGGDASNPPTVRIGSLNVLGPRNTGWTQCSGGLNKGGWATSTVSLVTLAETVRSLIDAFHSNGGHGAIGS